MKRIPIIKRKSLIGAGVTNSQLIELSKRNEYFRSRPGDASFFGPFNSLLIFIASRLFNFLPFRNVSEIVNNLVQNHRDLYILLTENPKRFLKVETKPIEVLEQLGIEDSGHYVIDIELTKSLKTLDWENHKEMVLINLNDIFVRIEDLFVRKGIEVSNEDGE